MFRDQFGVKLGKLFGACFDEACLETSGSEREEGRGKGTYCSLRSIRIDRLEGDTGVETLNGILVLV